MNDGPLSFLRSWEGFLPADAVVMAKRGEVQTQGVAAPTPVAIGFEAPGLDTPDARPLLDKILAALELPPGEFAVFSDRASSVPSSVLVRFSLSEAEGSHAGIWEGSVLTTYSLRAMLTNAGLKKPVWNHLKDAVQKIRLRTR